MTETVDLKCPKCGRFIAEVAIYGRGKCCGYEIEITLIRRPKPADPLTTSVPPT